MRSTEGVGHAPSTRKHCHQRVKKRKGHPLSRKEKKPGESHPGTQGKGNNSFRSARRGGEGNLVHFPGKRIRRLFKPKKNETAASKKKKKKKKKKAKLRLHIPNKSTAKKKLGKFQGKRKRPLKKGEEGFFLRPSRRGEKDRDSTPKKRRSHLNWPERREVYLGREKGGENSVYLPRPRKGKPVAPLSRRGEEKNPRPKKRKKMHPFMKGKGRFPPADGKGYLIRDL